MPPHVCGPVGGREDPGRPGQAVPLIWALGHMCALALFLPDSHVCVFQGLPAWAEGAARGHPPPAASSVVIGSLVPSSTKLQVLWARALTLHLPYPQGLQALHLWQGLWGLPQEV